LTLLVVTYAQQYALAVGPVSVLLSTDYIEGKSDGLCFRVRRVSRWNVEWRGWETSTVPRECHGLTEAAEPRAVSISPLSSSSDWTLQHKITHIN